MSSNRHSNISLSVTFDNRGAVEKSLGVERTAESGVMIDTFAPVRLTGVARSVDEESYPYSWLEGEI